MPGIEGAKASAALANPLQVISALFDAANQDPARGDSDWGVEDYFRQLAKDPQIREKIPLLLPETIDSIPDNALCRYRGMVQDMLDPEYYVGAFKRSDGSWQTTKYSDSTSTAINMDAESVVWERKPLYCSSIPGESPWCKQASQALLLPQSHQQPDANGSGKRERDDDGDTTMEECQAQHCEHGCQQGAKRTVPDQSQQALKDHDKDSNALPPSLAPQPGDCMVYVYEREESLKLNDMVEFVGVMSRVPELAAMQMNQAEDGTEQATFLDEEMAARPPTSQVPRIHAITASKLTGTEDLLVIPYKGPAERQAQVADLRAAALQFLTKAFGGDSLAAEYVLLQLVSRTYSRTEAAALGLLSVGITGCPLPKAAASRPQPESSQDTVSEFGQSIAAAVSCLTPRCIALPLSIGQLNRATLRSGRDMKSNRLTRSPLQLAENTHLILDETLLKAGQLTALGVNNLQAVKALLETKKVEYDFSFYTLPVMADVPVTILSESKSLLHASLDVTIPLKTTSDPASLEEISAASKGEEMNSIRAYLGLVRHMEFGIDAQMTSFLENELVARLLALSHGQDALTSAQWQAMKELEHARCERLRCAK